ncbi:DUF2357 domain-containing protein [Neptuniibacter halophilus]|uniref:DUF2357 domain-containing protein n=1 Tax=Neptuniibacter halophilus TaxID=651666 RepID=UPI00330603C2
MTVKLKVFCRRQEPPSFIGELSAEKTLQGVEENHHYLISVDAETSRLYVDDALLPMDARREFWLWSPGFYAGEVELELEQEGLHAPVRFLIDVAPAQHKTGREQYIEYISQIADYAPQLLTGTEPAKHGLGGQAKQKLSLWIRYARFRCFIDRYLYGLKAISERPIVRLNHHREQLPIHLARRVDVTTVRRLSANPKLLAVVAKQPGQAHNRIIENNRLDVPFNEPTMDNPANRLMAQQLDHVLRMVDGLVESFSNYSSTSGETESDILSRMPRRLNYLAGIRKRLLKLSRNTPFSAADKSKTGVAGLNAVSGSPHYDLAYRVGVRLLRQGLSELADDEQHYLAPTWEVYEAWCFVALARQLEVLLPGYEWRLKSAPAFADMVLVGQSGDQAVSLYSQLVCRSMEEDNHYGYCSISRERRPDLVLEYRKGQQVRFICLDSKYTAYRSRILDSMASAHIYRDSIKFRGKAPSLSVLLVPANKEVPRLSDPDYLDTHGVGCLTLVNNRDAVELLKRMLRYLQN